MLTEERIDMAIQPLLVAKILQYFIVREKINLVIAGKQSIDDDLGQTGQMLAALLGWPQAVFASKVDLSENECLVERDIDGGVQAVKLPLPCLVTCDLRLNEPRNASIKQIMAAKKKNIETVELKSINVGKVQSFQILSVEEPPKRKGGVKVADVDELLKRLKQEAKVL